MGSPSDQCAVRLVTLALVSSTRPTASKAHQLRNLDAYRKPEDLIAAGIYVDNFPMQLTRVKVHASQHEGVVQCLPSRFTNNGNNAKQCSTPSIPKQPQQQNMTDRGVPTHRGPNAGQSKGRARQVLQQLCEQQYVFASGSGRTSRQCADISSKTSRHAHRDSSAASFSNHLLVDTLQCGVPRLTSHEGFVRYQACGEQQGR